MNAARDGSGGVAFLADQMLARVARHLRLLGYDCELASGGKSDEALVRHARDRGRILLTCAKSLGAIATNAIVAPPTGDTPTVIRTVVQRWPLDFATSMFTRCCVCNTPVEPISRERAAGTIPEQVLCDRLTLTACPRCSRVYWEGGHVARMRESFSRLYGIATQAPPS